MSWCAVKWRYKNETIHQTANNASTQIRALIDCRILEWLGMEGTSKIIQFQPPCHGKAHQPPDQAAQSHVQPGMLHSVSILPKKPELRKSQCSPCTRLDIPHWQRQNRRADTHICAAAASPGWWASLTYPWVIDVLKVKHVLKCFAGVGPACAAPGKV